MSGYGGAPPPGWQDPYGGDQYGPGTPGYGYGPPGVPVQPANNGSAVAALVCNCLSLILCCGVPAIAGIITSALAMGRVSTDPESARKLTMWSWVAFGVSVVVGLIITVLYVVLVIMTDDYSSTPTYY